MGKMKLEINAYLTPDEEDRYMILLDYMENEEIFDILAESVRERLMSIRPEGVSEIDLGIED